MTCFGMVGNWWCWWSRSTLPWTEAQIPMIRPVILSKLVLALVWLGTAVPGACQAQKGPPNRARILEVAREIMVASRYPSLITSDDAGRTHARPMDAFLPDDDFVVWMGTNPVTRKVGQIRGEPRVTLYYFDPESLGYVTLAGTARIVDDPAEKDRRWKDGWEAFYPDRESGYALIEVVPEWIEVVSEARGVTGDATSWRPPRVQFEAPGS